MKSYQKWRNNNREQYRDYMREYQYDNYEIYKDAALARKKKSYAYKKEARIFLDILSPVA